MASQDSLRLDSWKEIAAYLDRDVSTVMRWEKRSGMPVHRVPGAKRGRSVFAYATELDDWLADETPEGPERPVPAMRPRLGGAVGLLLAAALVFAVISILAATGLVRVGGASGPSASGSAAGTVTSVEMANDAIVARNVDAEVVWTHRHPQGYSYKNLTYTEIFDLQGDGRAQVLVAVNARHPSRPESLQGELYSFSESGDLLWRIVLDDAYRFGKTSYSAPWVSLRANALGINGKIRATWTVNHYTWWPSVLVSLDGSGEIVGKFVNSGWLLATNFIDRPEGELLLVGGISNSRQGAMLAVLDARDPSGSSPEEPGSPYECLDCPEGKLLRYFVFPRSDVNEALGLAYNSAARVEVTNDQVNVGVREGPQDSDIQRVYEFSHDFELLRIVPGDTYWPQHRLLSLEGKIDHDEASCPERTPGPILSWTPENGWNEKAPRGCRYSRKPFKGIDAPIDRQARERASSLSRSGRSL